MFEKCDNLEELSDMSLWNLENVTSLRGLFYFCKKLKKIPGIDKWNPIKLQKEDCCTEMFLGCCLSLNEEQVSQVMKWENVKEEIKNECKDGSYIKNEIDFAEYLLTKKT